MARLEKNYCLYNLTMIIYLYYALSNSTANLSFIIMQNPILIQNKKRGKKYFQWQKFQKFLYHIQLILYHSSLILYLVARMKQGRGQKHNVIQQVMDSYCQVCFVPFNKVAPRKIDEGEQICFCVSCKCRVHKCCYDLEANSSFITNKLREFICQRCSNKELIDKGCTVCHRKEGALKIIGGNQVIHVFCALMHKDIYVTGYFPDLAFKKSQNYKDIRNVCGLCSKPNATQQCISDSCFKKFHGYCILLNLKAKQIQEQDPQCEKYYLSSGDNGKFDLSQQIMPRAWLYQQFDRVLATFEEHGFKLQQKQKQNVKNKVYEIYEKQQKEQRDQTKLKRGGFAYILCKDHQSSVYCNCLNHGSGDMVQCQCCFQWYHQKCVNYDPQVNQQHYICNYCNNFYDLKRKIIDQVRSSKTQHYQLKFQPPKLHLNDYIWLMRVIDHRIAGGAAAKMIKQLAKYPLKTSKMELMIRNQNKKKITNITDAFIQKYLESPQHQAILKPRPVLGLDHDQKPIILHKNVEYNKSLKAYVDFIQNYVKRNNLPDSFGSLIHELRFKERAIEDSYDTILQLSKSPSGYAEIPILKMKVEEYSFMEVIRDIDSGSMIQFEDLQSAVHKAKQSSNVPAYLLKPLIQRYEKVKNLVQLVTKHIHQKKQSSPEVQNAIKKLKDEKIYPPQIYRNFHEEKKFIKDLYLFYLKQEGKPLEQSLQNSDKIKILLHQPACKPNSEIAECVNSINIEGKLVHDHIGQIIEKYSRICVTYELKDHLKRKIIRLSTLENLYRKYEQLKMMESEDQISTLMQTWKKTRELWIETKTNIEAIIDQIDNIDGLTTVLTNIQETIQYLTNLPLDIADKAEDVPELGSVYRLQQLKNWIDTLIILCTQSQLKKNPFTISKLPQGLPKQNPLVKQYFILKKQQNELLNKYNSIYSKINEKIEILKTDLKKPRKEQMKQNLQKPKLTDINNFIDQLRQSKINMDSQIKQLTKTVNKTIQIGSKVNKFIQQQKHHQSMFKQDQIDIVKKQIDQLRKRVLTQAELSLQSELKQLYIAQICIRMQKMIITSNAQLDKMSKLLKFAQEEGLNNLQTYKRLKSKFQVGNQSTKQINLTKKHQQYLNNQATKLKDNDTFYSNLVFARKSLPLSIPQTLKQKNKHYQDLLTRNQYLRKKIQFIINQQPKKYDLQQAKITYLQALKHPFEIDGLGKLINQFQKAQQVLNLWKQNRQLDDSNDRVFILYGSLIFNIEEIQNLRKTIIESQNITQKVRDLRKNDLSLNSMCRVQQYLQIVQQNNASKNSKTYHKFKLEYYQYWMKLLQKFRDQQNQSIPFSKIKSILLDIYTAIQRNLRINSVSNNDELKKVVVFFEDILVGIRNTIQQKGQNAQNIYSGFIDIEQLKYQIQTGADYKQQVKIYNPFNDLNRFYTIDLQRSHSRNFDDFNTNINIKRQKTQNSQLQDPYFRQTKLERSHKSILSQSKLQQDESSDKKMEDWEKNQSSIVSEAQRNKAKQLLLKNIKKNSELSTYQNLPQQVKMIQNQLFGDNHNQIVKYFEMVNSFEKLFIKLLSCPNISAKVGKKNFQWDFLKLLISNLQQINEIQQMLVQKNKQSAITSQPQKKILQKKQSKDNAKEEIQKDKKQMKEKQKQRTIEEMIASGKIDEDIKNEMKKQIKAIRDKNKKKKHKSSSRRRSRSRSRSSQRSPQAKFSSDSEQNKLPVFIQKQYNQTVDKPYFNDIYSSNIPNNAPLLYDPQQQQQNVQSQKKNFPKGSLLQLRPMELQITVRKKLKTTLKTYLMTLQQYSKISAQLVDPGFTNLQLKKDKDELQIIQYLSKPSRKKYKFLVGWFQAYQPTDRETTQLIRDFASECNQRKKIYGFQNETIKVHIMSINQYVKIMQLYDAPNKVSTWLAAQILKKQRLIYIIQYPSQKMYELKGIYSNFNDVISKQTSYDVDVPQTTTVLPIDNRNLNISNINNLNSSNQYLNINNPYTNMGINYNPLLSQSQQQNVNIKNAIDVANITPLKPVQYEGWGTQSSNNSSYSLPNIFNTSANTNINSSSSLNPLNSLGRFSPILTDQQDNDNNYQSNKQKMQNINTSNTGNVHNTNTNNTSMGSEKQIDLVSNILNSLADVNIPAKPEMPPANIPQRVYQSQAQPQHQMHQIQQQRYDQSYRYQPNLNMNPMGMNLTPNMSMGMNMNPNLNMNMNIMQQQRWQTQPQMLPQQINPNRASMPYNPMNMAQPKFIPPPPNMLYKNPMMPNPYTYPIPPPNQNQAQQGKQGQGGYDPYMYQRQ